MEHLIFVESTTILKKFQEIIPKEFKLLSLDQIFKISNKVVEDNLPVDDMEVIADLIKNSMTIHIVFTENYFRVQSIYAKFLSKFNVKQFNRVNLDNLAHANIQIAFNNAISVEIDEINFMLAKDKIDHIVGVDINNLLKWFLRKNNILNLESLEKIHLTRLILYSLEVLVSTQDNIDNFIGETYEKLAIDYSFNTVQFRVKNNKKFKKDMQEELMLMYNQTIDSKNKNMVEKFERGIKSIPAPEPLTKNSLQKTASLIYGFTPREALKIARELFNGIDINGDKVSLITSINTNSTRINEDKRMKIKEFIEKEYDENYFFNGERSDKKKSTDYENKEAIVPTNFTDEFLPEKIKAFLTNDQFIIYNYIYKRTITSQMSNASRDDTLLIVNVGGNKFKAAANKLLFEGWIKEGKYWDPDLEINSEIVEIPEDLYVGMELDKHKLDVVPYPVKERTPMRYSTGRFFDKALNDVTAEENEITFLLDNLLDQGLVKIELKNMLEPSEKGKRIYYILKEFVPSIIDKDFVLQTQVGLKAVKEGKFEKEALIHEYQKELSLLRDSLGYNGETSEEWKKEEARKIAKENNQKLPDYILDNKTLLNEYILKNDKKIEKLGYCPSCKSGEIYEQSKGFSCNNSRCNFVVWKNNINRFFERFNKTVNEESYKDYIRVILAKGKILIENLFFNDNFFNKDVVITFNEQYNNWGFSLLKKNVIPQIIHIEDDTKVNQDNQSISDDKIEQHVDSVKHDMGTNEDEVILTSEQTDLHVKGYCIYVSIEDNYVLDNELLNIFIDKEKEDNRLKNLVEGDEKYILIFGEETESLEIKNHYDDIKKRANLFFGMGNVFVAWTIVDESIDECQDRVKDEIVSQKTLPVFRKRIKF